MPSCIVRVDDTVRVTCVLALCWDKVNKFQPQPTFSPPQRTDNEGDSESAMLVLPEGHKDGVPFLMNNNLLRQDGLGASFFLHQVVFAHEHSVRELVAGGQNRLLWPDRRRCAHLISSN